MKRSSIYVGSFVALLFALWVWLGQSLTRFDALLLDLSALTAGLLGAFTIRRRWVALGDVIVPSLVALTAAWCVVSLIDPWLRQPARTSRRDLATQAQAEKPSIQHGEEWPPRRVALALSGGGYRAAAYHAGVLNALGRLGVVVSHISSVSGGSIIGAYYARGGDPASFRDIVANGTLNLRRRLSLIQNAIRLPLAGFSRSTAQSEMLREMLPDEPASCPECPTHLVAATDLNFGLQVGLLREGVLLVDEAEGWREFYPEVRGLESLDLASRVAVSGTFPGAFPPQRVDIEVRRRRGLGYEPAQMATTRMLVLVDGGVGDNTGLSLLRVAQELSRPGSVYDGAFPDWRIDSIIVSDASAIFGLGGANSGLGVLARAVDVIGARSSRGMQGRLGVQRDLIWLGPQRNFLSPTALFSASLEHLTDEGLASRQLNAWFNPLAYPDAVLEALVGVLAEPHRRVASAELMVFSAIRAAEIPYPPLRSSTLNRLINLVSRSRSREDCRQLAAREFDQQPEFRKMACAAVALKLAVRGELDRLSIVFRETSTLDDQLGRSVTLDLFALGEAQTFVEWPRLKLLLTGTPIDPTAGDPEAQERPPTSSR